MSTSSSKKRGPFWRTDWFVAIVITAAVLVLHQLTGTIETLERRFYDFASVSGGRQPSDRIAVITIDDQSVANMGRWPWPRDVHAELTDLLAAAKAKTIVYTTFFFEPQTDRGLGFIRKLSLSKRPEARYQDGERFAADLRSTLDELAVASSRPGGSPGYDAPEAAPARANEVFAKTNVMGKPARPGGPATGDVKTDLEAPPGKL